jgi:hypothetical protein
MIQKIGQIRMTTINRRMHAFFSVKQIRKNARLPAVEEFVGGPESIRFGFGGGNGGGQDAAVSEREKAGRENRPASSEWLKKGSVNHERHRQSRDSTDAGREFPVCSDPTGGGGREHRRTRAFRVGHHPIGDMHRHADITSDMHL